MAISSLNKSFEKVPRRSTSSAHSSKHASRLFRLNVAPESTISSSTSKCSKCKCSKLANNNSKSPYLTGDRVKLLSRVIEKRFVKKTNIFSSYPLPANLYKTNSDDCKPQKKVLKKIKKSVLTLPNDPAPVPQGCTLSDMNDSEYCNKEDEDRKRKLIKKRATNQNKRKARVREKDIEYYDKDAKYCSQLNTNLDCSSTDMTKSFNGDGKRVKNRKKNLPTSNKTQTASKNLSDVWAVLRNINSFQFRPSPPMSEDSIVRVKKNVQNKLKKPNRKDARMIETCRTQEFSYISRYEVDHKSPVTFSPSSSIDRVTVIENQDNFSKICKQFEKRLHGTHDFLKGSNNRKNRIQKNKPCKSPKSNDKAQVNVGSKDYKQLITKKKKIKINLTEVVEQSNSKLTNIRTENNDSLINTDTSQLTSDSNILPNKTEKDSMYLAKVGLDSDYTGSSKTELPNKMNDHVSRNDKTTDVAVLTKEHEPTSNVRKRLDSQKRKSRLLTTMPSSCMIAKLTQTEIKRRLTNMRFPIVVLGKDEVSSSVTVVDYEPPQFNGLDDHIWPFMVEWSPNSQNDTNHDKNMLNRKYESYLIDTINSESKSRKANNEEGTYKRVSLRNRKQANDDSTANKAKFKITTTSMPVTKDKLLECTKKQKSIIQLKDKMLNFLYKRSPNRDNCENDESKSLTLNDKFAMNANNVSALTDKQLRQDNVLVLKNLPIKRILSAEKKAPLYKHPWAKAKRASDFIDNVMKKVRRGVYFTQDHIKEASVQAGSICDSTDYTQTDSETDSTDHGIKTKNQDNVISIPGFNNTLPLLEIKTLNMNQIAVKHCVTNIMVEFDVTVPTKDNLTKNLPKSSFPLTPIVKPESETKVYKCKTTILNAMLPAELCSILPKMMSSIALSSKSSLATPANSPSNQSCLSTITELTRYENGDSASVVALIPRSPDIERILEGKFSNKDYNMLTLHKNNFNIEYDQCLVTELLPVVLMNNLLIYKESALLMELDSSQYTNSQVTLQNPIKKISHATDIQNVDPICTSVQIYNASNKIISSAFDLNNFVGMVESMMRSYNFQLNRNLSSYFDILKHLDGKNLKINLSMINDSGVQKTVSVTVSNLNVDSLYKAFPKIEITNEYQSDTRNAPLQCIEYVNTSLARKSQKTERTHVRLKKIKRHSFYKLYRKCRSTIQGSVDKCTSEAYTPLSKITTLDDFFQVLGSQTIFSSVFDGSVAKKILSSVIEMKNWISEINPKQAMLILLLNNKKETQNLVRFRPIILQGIAVNRITRASELDMEIEVIDRENFNKFPQFEGITYLAESVMNYENLLDELYWIAKTTASDYNKPFDESSERLLKSLLQKRKKLNPSYLRVMARYVGLGLVKTPTEY